jgi:acylphosphatase
MSTAIRQVTIRGRVQGVGYRAWVEHRARANDLEGWVRNLSDGSVEALFSGPAEAVAAMVERCRRGPSSARVDAVTEQEAGADALKLRRPGERFSVLPTI